MTISPVRRLPQPSWTYSVMSRKERSHDSILARPVARGHHHGCYAVRLALAGANRVWPTRHSFVDLACIAARVANGVADDSLSREGPRHASGEGPVHHD